MSHKKKIKDDIINGILDDFAKRLRAGEVPDIDEYVKKYPKYEKAIRKVFTIEMVTEMVLNPGILKGGSLTEAEMAVVWPGIQAKMRHRAKKWGKKSLNKWIEEAHLPNQNAAAVVGVARGWLGDRVVDKLQSRPSAKSSHGRVTAGGGRIAVKKPVTAFAFEKTETAATRTRGTTAKSPKRQRIELEIVEMSLSEMGKLYIKLKHKEDTPAEFHSATFEVVLESEDEQMVLGDFTLDKGNITIDLDLQKHDSI